MASSTGCRGTRCGPAGPARGWLRGAAAGRPRRARGSRRRRRCARPGRAAGRAGPTAPAPARSRSRLVALVGVGQVPAEVGHRPRGALVGAALEGDAHGFAVAGPGRRRRLRGLDQAGVDAGRLGDLRRPTRRRGRRPARPRRPWSLVAALGRARRSGRGPPRGSPGAAWSGPRSTVAAGPRGRARRCWRSRRDRGAGRAWRGRAVMSACDRRPSAPATSSSSARARARQVMRRSSIAALCERSTSVARQASRWATVQARA